jgi:hypothetical protein
MIDGKALAFSIYDSALGEIPTFGQSHSTVIQLLSFSINSFSNPIDNNSLI